MTFTPTQLADISRVIDYRTAAGVGRGGMDERTARTLTSIFADSQSDPALQPSAGLATDLKNDAVTTLLKLVLAASASDCAGCQNLTGVIDPNGEVVPQFAGQTYNQTNIGKIWVNLLGGVDDEWTGLAIYPIE